MVEIDNGNNCLVSVNQLKPNDLAQSHAAGRGFPP